MYQISQDFYVDTLIDAFRDKTELHAALRTASIELTHTSLCIKHNKLKQAQLLAANAELIIQTTWGINSKMGIATVNMFSIMFNKKILAMTRIEETLAYQARMQLRDLFGSIE